jgi:hypothetical protein
MGIELFQLAYLRAKMDGAPDKALDNIRRWIASADKMRSKARAAALPPPMPGMGQPLPPGAPSAIPGAPQQPQAMPPQAGAAPIAA